MDTLIKRSDVPHLISLLDDPDDAVALVVRNRLMSIGVPITGILRQEMRQSDNTTLTRRLGHLIANIELDQVYKDLESWCKEPDPDLLKGMCLIFNVACPEVPTNHIFDTVFDLAQEVWVELSDQKTVIERIHLFNHIFYHRIGFCVVDPFLMQFDKSLLHKAIETKQANPVVIGLLYIAAAGLAGIPVGAVVFPGGFLPACIHEDGRILFYINICQSGEVFGHEQLLAVLKDFGFPTSKNMCTCCHARTLAGIYAESLYYLAGSIGDRELEIRMEYTLKFFGEKRILFIEEDDDDEP